MPERYYFQMAVTAVFRDELNSWCLLGVLYIYQWEASLETRGTGHLVCEFQMTSVWDKCWAYVVKFLGINRCRIWCPGLSQEGVKCQARKCSTNNVLENTFLAFSSSYVWVWKLAVFIIAMTILEHATSHHIGSFQMTYKQFVILVSYSES